MRCSGPSRVGPFEGPATESPRLCRGILTGGAEPAWRGDGRERYFVDASAELTAAAVTASASGFAVGPVTRLFNVGPFVGGRLGYDVSRDGQRFLVRTNVPTAPASIMVMLNWRDRLNH